jgi:phosphoribosylglycinamide formyltransferase-1
MPGLSKPSSNPLPIVVLISGNGSNLQAIIDAVQNDHLPVEIRAVISNRADAFGLQRARQAGIPTHIVPHQDYASREDFDRALQHIIDQQKPALVILAGFMRILTDAFVRHYEGRLLNIHPSLLPKFQGLRTHQRALDAGESEHGATVHFVTHELDGGPAILQARVAVVSGEDAQQLAQRVLQYEHQIYPQVIRWLAEGRLALQDQTVIFDGEALQQPLQYSAAEQA